MAANRLPTPLDQLFALAEDMADGLHEYEATVGVKQNTEAALRGALDAARAAQNLYATARTAKAGLTSAQTVADSNVKSFTGVARDVLAPSLGTQWNPQWIAVGFMGTSLAIPRTMGQRLSLVANLRDYFTANPGKENGPLNVTSARAGTLHTALSDAMAAVNLGLTGTAEKKAARNIAADQLRTRMDGLIGELEQLLDALDPRWHAFGLNLPGQTELCDPPTGLVVVAGVPGTLVVDWADTPRATHYRVWRQIVGIDQDFIAAASPQDSDVTLQGLLSGATVHVRVTAVNEAGESQPSETRTAVAP